ncbi:hypothetical protein WL94_13650 [Burkholderia cepacia]|uniref:RHS repeat domain-containing protein n=1 Tax=Burkholderia cepacia TaxID=292 RepID=UPI00075ED200|nr:RHS domain-containing protein [Burkholderia cepacia]KWF91423.1 hypothetical protein WL94_13650 [Burkholderia cepacia]
MKAVVRKDRLRIGTTHFEYDAFGRRIRKFNGNYASTDFRWGGMRLVRETYHDRQGEEALTYLYETNSYVPLARIDHGTPAANDADARDEVNYFHNDVSGLPEALTDADGELIWQARYKMWGNSVQEEWVAHRSVAAWVAVQEVTPTPVHVPKPQNSRFQGPYLDRETGLHCNTFRFYDPDIGRFINSGPIGLMRGSLSICTVGWAGEYIFIHYINWVRLGYIFKIVAISLNSIEKVYLANILIAHGDVERDICWK